MQALSLLLREVKLLAVTIVITMEDDRPDGSNPMRTHMGWQDSSRIFLREYLRNPVIHTDPDHTKDNYILDWMKLANEQLFRSGAGFGLDLQNIIYRVVKDTTLNRWICRGGGGYDLVENILKDLAERDDEQNPSGPNPYRNRVIFVFRWGRKESDGENTATNCEPVQLSCSSPWVSAVYMGGYPRYVKSYDGNPVRSCLLTHEFGHYMGLWHTHDQPARRKMWEFWQAVEDGTATRENQLHDANEWLRNRSNSLDNDKENGLAYGPAVCDTPVDLGLYYCKLNGHEPCADNAVYDIEVAGGTVQETMDVDAVRDNVMGYWRCDPEQMKFTPDQVERMHHVLEQHRDNVGFRTAHIPVPRLVNSFFELASWYYRRVYLPVTCRYLQLAEPQKWWHWPIAVVVHLLGLPLQLQYRPHEAARLVPAFKPLSDLSAWRLAISTFETAAQAKTVDDDICGFTAEVAEGSDRADSDES